MNALHEGEYAPWRILSAACRVAVVVFGLAAAPSHAATGGNDVFGSLRYYLPEGDTTLLDVAREYGLGILDIQAANPGVDPWVPGDDLPVLLPTAYILPDAPREGIVINLAELRLYYFKVKGKPPITTAIGVGREGFMTPLGRTTIVRKQKDPTWRPTAGTRADKPELPGVVPPGPDNPLGAYALYLGWSTYLIHGTNKPWGVGRRVSRGCIRLYPEWIEKLFAWVPVGTKVTVVDQPIKLGWRGDELYIEVQPDRDQLDQLEATGTFLPGPPIDARDMIVAKAGDATSRVDWNIVDAALRQKLSIPIQITVPGATGT
jgi:L,D-transpeptidase ErfK/SrfK